MMAAGCFFGPSGTHEHTYSEKWSVDSEYHWHAATCEHTSEVSSKDFHSYGSDGKCSVCDYKNPHVITESQWVRAFEKSNFVKFEHSEKQKAGTTSHLWFHVAELSFLHL